MSKIESKVQEEILSYLKKNRIYHFRFQAQSNLNGLPDILCLYKGLFIGLELKREKGGTPSGLQLRKIKSINDNGGIGVIVRSVKEVKLLFDIIDRCEFEPDYNWAEIVRNRFEVLDEKK